MLEKEAVDRRKLSEALLHHGIETDAAWTTRRLHEELVKVKGIANYKYRLGDRKELMV